MKAWTDASRNSETQRSRSRRVHGFWLGVLALFGVILPVVTLSIELVTHMCAEAFFDPIPTLLHVLAVASVPLANAVALVALRRPPHPRRSWVWVGNGLAMGVSLFFATLYLPLMPLAAIAIVIFGWGLLPLSPLLSFITAWRIRSHLRRHLPADSVSFRNWWLCFAAALVGLLLLAAPENLTRTLAQMAVSDNPQTSAHGLKWLRQIGAEETLLRDCYGAGQREAIHPLRLLGLCAPVTSEQARQLYYRVTGHPFTSVKPPQARYHGRGWGFLDDFEWDPAVGGDSVAGLVKGLSLKESRVDAVCSPDDAWSYVEWILEFQNESRQQREARLQIGLPAGAVVSRVTLWVDGEEREAAFAGRGQTKEAYRKVVAQKRDPVLVTTSGPDRVLLQCFPVSPSGTMKVRIGVTAPLLLKHADETVLQWPCILERNFKIPGDFRHTVWLQTPQAPAEEPALLKHEQPQPNSHIVRGLLDDVALCNGTAAVRLKRNPEQKRAVTIDAADKNDARIVQTIEQQTIAKPSRIVAVVDGSQPMAAHMPEVANALTEMKSVAELSLMIARDDESQKADSSDIDSALGTLQKNTFRGGHDNVPALTRAWEKAAEKSGSVVLWIHAPQPVLVSSIEPLRQLLERHSADGGGPTIVEVAVQAGPDRVIERLDGLNSLKTIPRLGTVGDRIRDLTSQWRNTAPIHVATRQCTPASQTDSLSPAASKHIARLWAREEIDRLIRSRKTSEAITLGTAYQLVTAVTGAVVLENAQQYAQNNLHPADPASVPTIVPEPATRILVALGFLVILIAESVRRRNRATPA